MRLINTSTYELEYFADFSHAPGYAILSHTWSENELLYADLLNADVPISSKPGYDKLHSACVQAKAESLPYIWIDSCCIDKTSSSELSQALNSMFMWYQNAVQCYVYLDDVSLNYINALASGPAETAREDPSAIGLKAKSSRDRALLNALGSSRWFTRGWTLQELLAPRHIQFFDRVWSKIGTLTELVGLVSNITSIPLEALRKYTPLNQFSVAKRMSWAANRETTIIEDRAYSLLGIFDINMPLLYGEGEKSFIRLQREIVRTSNDQSILIWGGSHLAFFYPRYTLFAPSPQGFQHCGSVAKLQTRDPRRSFELTNNGLRISCPVVRTRRRGRSLALLSCYDEQTPDRVFALPVTTLENNEALFNGRDFSSYSLRTFQRLHNRPQTLIFTERNSSSSAFATNESSRKVLLRFYDARRYKDKLQLPGTQYSDSTFVLRRVCGQPAWDVENDIWNPHVLTTSLPGLISAGFEINVKTTDGWTWLRVVFSDFGPGSAD